MTASASSLAEVAQPNFSARGRLLAAAENILIQQGFHALTTRAICGNANTNLAQISYYFGGLEGLLDALLAEELQAVSHAFDAATLTECGQDIASVMGSLVKALSAPAPYTSHGFAALAVEEIYHHVSGDMQQRAATALNAAHEPYRKVLQHLLPEMDQLTVRIRLTAVIAMVMSMLPGNTGSRLLALSTADQCVCDDRLFDEMLTLCILAWQP